MPKPLEWVALRVPLVLRPPSSTRFSVHSFLSLTTSPTYPASWFPRSCLLLALAVSLEALDSFSPRKGLGFDPLHDFAAQPLARSLTRTLLIRGCVCSCFWQEADFSLPLPRSLCSPPAAPPRPTSPNAPQPLATASRSSCQLAGRHRGMADEGSSAPTPAETGSPPPPEADSPRTPADENRALRDEVAALQREIEGLGDASHGHLAEIISKKNALQKVGSAVPFFLFFFFFFFLLPLFSSSFLHSPPCPFCPGPCSPAGGRPPPASSTRVACPDRIPTPHPIHWRARNARKPIDLARRTQSSQPESRRTRRYGPTVWVGLQRRGRHLPGGLAGH